MLRHLLRHSVIDAHLVVFTSYSSSTPRHRFLWSFSKGFRHTSNAACLNEKMGEELATNAPPEMPSGAEVAQNGDKIVKDGRKKLHGRAFYESIGSPKVVLAPMVDQSEYVRIVD
jgi:hypothetical protein